MEYATATRAFRQAQLDRLRKEEEALEEAEALEWELKAHKRTTAKDFTAWLEKREAEQAQKAAAAARRRQQLREAEEQRTQASTGGGGFKANRVRMDTPVDYATHLREQAMERQRRSEARKLELLRSSRLPGGMAENQRRGAERAAQRRARQAAEQKQQRQAGVRRGNAAKDPAAVVEELEWRQRRWAERDAERRHTVELEKVRRRQQASEEARSDPLQISEAEHRRRTDQRRARLRAKEQRDATRAERQAQRHYEKVMAQALPEARGTRAAALRRAALAGERRRAEQRRAAEDRGEAARAEKAREAGRRLAGVVGAWEAEYKNDGAYCPLEKDPRAAQARARQHTKTIRAKVRENQARYAAAAAAAPSLLERHDRALRQRKARAEAVSAVAQAVYGGGDGAKGGGWLARAQGEGLFDEEERALLGLGDPPAVEEEAGRGGDDSSDGGGNEDEKSAG